MCLTVRGPRPAHTWLLTPPTCCVLLLSRHCCCCCAITWLLPALPPLQPATKKKQRLDVDGSAAATGGDSGSTTIFCGNLPWSATEEQISALFADCGEVTGVRIGEWWRPFPSVAACSRVVCSALAVPHRSRAARLHIACITKGISLAWRPAFVL